MSTLDELKKNWPGAGAVPSQFDQKSFGEVVRARVKKQTSKAVQYFWGAFALQLLVYALLGNVMARNWTDPEIFWAAIGGAMLFIPFTVMLIKKFKGIAKTSLAGVTGASMREHIQARYNLLLGFYHFKKRYELVLIPLSSMVGVFVVFKLYVPGGVQAHWIGAAITLAITLVSCLAAIRAENNKHFAQPLAQLSKVLEEFKFEKA